jgi:rhamnosyltransferase
MAGGTMPDEGHQSVAVVIPTLDAGEAFPALLEALERQSVKPVEVVVADSQSTDHTCDTAREHGCRIITVKRNEFDHGGTRNLAARSTKADIVLFLTQDAIPTDEQMIENIIRPLEDEDIAIAYGRQLPRVGAGPLESFAREFNYPAASIVKDTASIASMGMKAFFCSDSCSAVRRSVFEELGGFPEQVVVNEDMLYAARALLEGKKVCYAAEARVYHSHPLTPGALWRRYYRTGRFFAQNRWLNKLAGLRGYGGGLLKAGMVRFWRERAFLAMAGLLAETVAKWLAFRAGWLVETLFGRDRQSDQGR